MMQEGSRLVKPTTLDDRMRRLLTTVPWLSSPTRLQLFLPRSIPRTAICIWLLPPFRIVGNNNAAGRWGGPSHKTYHVNHAPAVTITNTPQQTHQYSRQNSQPLIGSSIHAFEMNDARAAELNGTRHASREIETAAFRFAVAAEHRSSSFPEARLPSNPKSAPRSPLQPRHPPATRPEPFHQPAPRAKADANEVTSGEHVGFSSPSENRGFPVPPRDIPRVAQNSSPRTGVQACAAWSQRHVRLPKAARFCLIFR
jgi:hypothetical protein